MLKSIWPTLALPLLLSACNMLPGFGGGSKHAPDPRPPPTMPQPRTAPPPSTTPTLPAATVPTAAPSRMAAMDPAFLDELEEEIDADSVAGGRVVAMNHHNYEQPGTGAYFAKDAAEKLKGKTVRNGDRAERDAQADLLADDLQYNLNTFPGTPEAKVNGFITIGGGVTLASAGTLADGTCAGMPQIGGLLAGTLWKDALNDGAVQRFDAADGGTFSSEHEVAGHCLDPSTEPEPGETPEMTVNRGETTADAHRWFRRILKDEPDVLQKMADWGEKRDVTDTLLSPGDAFAHSTAGTHAVLLGDINKEGLAAFKAKLAVMQPHERGELAHQYGIKGLAWQGFSTGPGADLTANRALMGRMIATLNYAHDALYAKKESALPAPPRGMDAPTLALLKRLVDGYAKNGKLGANNWLAFAVKKDFPQYFGAAPGSSTLKP